jgi:sugar lactone lactonase YvrE
MSKRFNKPTSKARSALLAGLCLCVAPPLVYDVEGQDLVTTVAGSPRQPGASDGAGSNARFNDPAGIAVASDGTVYLADNRNHVIRAVDQAGLVSTLAGSFGASGADDGQGAAARFKFPTGITVEADGSLIVSDTGNHTIRRISAAGAVVTLAGAAGIADYLDGVLATARFSEPQGVAVASDGAIFVADCGNHVIRRVGTDGDVTTVAGRGEVWGAADGVGAAARFNNPLGLALDATGNLFVTDANNFTIRKITPGGEVSTLAGAPGIDGSIDGAGAAARFGKPAELAVDLGGNLYVADASNHAIRKVSPDGFVTTVSGVVRQSGSLDGADRAARFFNPYGVACSPRGSLLLTDAYNQTVRELLAPFTVALLRESDQVVVSWRAVIGERYRVQYADRLDSEAWTNLGGEITAASQSVSAAHPTPGADGVNFFRVVLLK